MRIDYQPQFEVNVCLFAPVNIQKVGTAQLKLLRRILFLVYTRVVQFSRLAFLGVSS